MLYLLTLHSDTDVWLWPAADRSAARLEQALLERDADACRACVVQALEGDALLANWLAATAGRAGAPGPSTLAEAASWLADDLLQRLAATIAGSAGGSASRVAAVDAVRFAKHALAAAQRAQAAANDAPRWSRDRIYWQTLCADQEAFQMICPREPLGRARLLPAFPPVAPQPHEPSGQLEEFSHWQPAAGELLRELDGVEWRLPALVRRLAAASTIAQDFERRLEAEKLAALKELAYGAGHEINNPLANIAARAQTLLRDEADAGRRQKLAAIHKQALRAHEMLADLMLFARPPILEQTEFELAQLVQQVTLELIAEAAQRGVTLVHVTAAHGISTRVRADATQLAVALKAVVVNALEAVSGGGRVEIAVRAPDAETSDVRVIVRDNGPGIAPEVRPHVFDPFFSGREAGRGLGFGLSKCWRIVTDHGGRVAVTDSDQGGAELTIYLPCCGDQHATDSHQDAAVEQSATRKAC